MSARSETRIVPFAARQMFDLVGDVRRYPEFLPWCKATRIRSVEERDGAKYMTADLVASFRVFEERFTSRVRLDEAKLRIDVSYVDGPFRQLTNAWSFEPLGPSSCRVRFDIDFEFKSRVLQAAASVAFDRVFARMSDAFEARARSLYGENPGLT
jgi:coenzyme Q-binding protein COQ10